MIRNSSIDQHICPAIAPRIAAVLLQLPSAVRETLTEIRLRVNLPLMVSTGVSDNMVTEAGTFAVTSRQAFTITQTDLLKTLQMISKNSLYALENEIRAGFVTIAGGHRVGLAGQALVENGQVKSLKNISSINIRIARQIIGCADQLIPWLINPKGHIYNTLIVSPPRCGKTTVIRDIARQLSSGIKELNVKGMQVGIVDERSEIAACQFGVPSMDLGDRIDILDSCPKATGMLMLIRSMAPQVIITDELGREEDALAVEEAVHAGVSVIATAHGHSIVDIKKRPCIKKLIEEECFERYVTLSSIPSMGSMMTVSATNGQLLYSHPEYEVRPCG